MFESYHRTPESYPACVFRSLGGASRPRTLEMTLGDEFEECDCEDGCETVRECNGDLVSIPCTRCQGTKRRPSTAHVHKGDWAGEFAYMALRYCELCPGSDAQAKILAACEEARVELAASTSEYADVFAIRCRYRDKLHAIYRAECPGCGGRRYRESWTDGRREPCPKCTH